MAAAPETRECPFCKETVKVDAIRCKHCRSMIPDEKPTHNGTCPLCKESIKPDAIKCKQCGSAVGGSSVQAWSDDDCGCGKTRGTVDAASMRVLDAGPDTTLEPGAVAAPRGYGCTACKDDGSGLIVSGRWTHRSGTRSCSMMVPWGRSPSGLVTWKRIEWTESCKGTLVNDPWA